MKQTILFLLVTISTTGCSIAPELIAVGAAGIQAVSAKVNKDTSENYKKIIAELKEIVLDNQVKLENITTRDCHLYKYQKVPCDVRQLLWNDAEGREVLMNIARENKKYSEQCPNAVIPDKPDCPPLSGR